MVYIPMCNNCVPLIADLFSFLYKRGLILSHSQTAQSEVIEAFNFLLGIRMTYLKVLNNFFERIDNRIYPTEHQLNASHTEASFLDLHLSISDSFVKTKIFGKLVDFDIFHF